MYVVSLQVHRSTEVVFAWLLSSALVRKESSCCSGHSLSTNYIALPKKPKTRARSRAYTHAHALLWWCITGYLSSPLFLKPSSSSSSYINWNTLFQKSNPWLRTTGDARFTFQAILCVIYRKIEGKKGKLTLSWREFLLNWRTSMHHQAAEKQENG